MAGEFLDRELDQILKSDSGISALGWGSTPETEGILCFGMENGTDVYYIEVLLMTPFHLIS